MEAGQESQWLKCGPFPQNTGATEGERAFIQICLESFCIAGIVIDIRNSKMNKIIVPGLKCLQPRRRGGIINNRFSAV